MGVKWGDRPGARYIRDIPGLATIMLHLMPKRTESEVYLSDKIDATEIVRFMEQKNAEHDNYKTRRWNYGSTMVFPSYCNSILLFLVDKLRNEHKSFSSSDR